MRDIPGGKVIFCAPLGFGPHNIAWIFNIFRFGEYGIQCFNCRGSKEMLRARLVRLAPTVFGQDFIPAISSPQSFGNSKRKKLGNTVVGSPSRIVMSSKYARFGAGLERILTRFLMSVSW